MHACREKAHTEFKGFINGIEAGRQLNPTEKDMLNLLEYMIDGFKYAGDDRIAFLELHHSATQRINTLETKIEELETNIQQLRETLDEMFQAR